MRLFERHQVIDIEFARIGEDAAGIRIMPLAGNDAATPIIQGDGNVAFGDQHFLARVLTIPIGIGPAGKIVFAVIGCVRWTSMTISEFAPMAVIVADLAVMMTPGTVQPATMGEDAGGEDEGINKGGKFHST